MSARFCASWRSGVHGRAHLQTVSVFGPELIWKPWLREPIFRHPLLDFASVHLYEEGTIDFPLDTIAPALAAGRLIRDALGEIRDHRPVLDTEHGPIHTFKDHGRTLPDAFDDEYFRHMQWAHVASGAVGGGMRWPNREPHVLTPGMRAAQLALARFLPLIDWPRFRRRNLRRAVGIEGGGVACFSCGDEHQALLWLLRTDCIAENGRVYRDGRPARVRLLVPGLAKRPLPHHLLGYAARPCRRNGRTGPSRRNAGLPAARHRRRSRDRDSPDRLSFQSKIGSDEII